MYVVMCYEHFQHDIIIYIVCCCYCVLSFKLSEVYPKNGRVPLFQCQVEMHMCSAPSPLPPPPPPPPKPFRLLCIGCTPPPPTPLPGGGGGGGEKNEGCVGCKTLSAESSKQWERWWCPTLNIPWATHGRQWTCMRTQWGVGHKRDYGMYCNCSPAVPQPECSERWKPCLLSMNWGIKTAL